MDLEIQCGFNANDETINFGSRALADNESYESVTLATVKTPEYNIGTPLINAMLRNGQIFYSIDKLFGIFKDKEYSEVKFSCLFKTIVDIICVSVNNSLTYIFLRDGTLQIVRTNSEEYSIVNTLHLLNLEEHSDEKLFIDSYIEGFEQKETTTESSLIIITSVGQIFRLKVIELEDSDVTVVHELIFDLESTIHLSAYGNSLLFLKGSKIWVIDLFTDAVISTRGLDIKYAQFADLRILALLNSGKLVYICPYSLFHFYIETDISIHTMSSLVDERSIMKYIAAESMENESGEKYLHLLHPDLSIVYSLKISSRIQIVTPEIETDEVHYISFVKDEDKLDELRFQCVYETDPEKRLFRLFRRKMFDEAERFAKTHNIDVSIVNKEKAKLIVEKSNCTSQDIDELIEILKSLSDQEFILDCCTTVECTCSTAEDVLRILKYGCDLEVDKKNKCAKEKQFECNELYFRFNIFLAIGYDMEKWMEFSTCYLLDELKKLLRNQQITKAITLYSYMNMQQLNNLDEIYINEIIDVLNCIDLDVVVPFLPTFIPITLDYLPSTVPIFVDWIKMVVFQMEKQYIDSFPQNAIDFMETTADYLKIKKANSTRHADLNTESLIGNLQKLLKSLNELQVLKSNYGVRIALKEFIQDPKSVIKILLNLELELDVYNRILQEFTYKFILDNELNPDGIFWDELISILYYQESYWSNIVGSILNCISSIDLKLQAVEKILLQANLPWSSTVKNLGIQILENTHPMVYKIQNLIEEEPVMIVLNKKEYSLKNFNCSSIDDLKFLLGRIIFCNLPTMISDAFQLCKGKEQFQIEAMRALFLHFINMGDFENIFKLMDEDKSLVKKALEYVLEDIVCLNDSLETAEAENYINALKLMTKKYYSLADDECAIYEWQKKTDVLMNIHNLAKYFNVKVSNEITQVEKKKNIINQIITEKIAEYEEGSITIPELLNSCHRLSSSSGINREKLLLQYCLKVVVNKNEFLCSVAEDFLIYSNRVKYLSILTVYLLQNLNSKGENQITETSFIDYSPAKVNNNSGITLKLALNLITKAVANSESEELSACLKISPWVDSIYFLKRYRKDREQDHIFEDVFDIDHLNPSSGALMAIQKLFNMYTSFIAQYKSEEYKFLTYFNRNQETVTEEEFLNEIEDFGRLIYVLNQDGESLLSYKLLTTLQNQLMVHEDLDPEIGKILNEMIKKHCIPNLIQSSLLMGELNENLLHNSLLWCDSKEIEKYIEHALKLHRKLPSKVAIIARIGVKMFDFHKNIGPRNYCKQVLLNVAWWEKLKHLNIEYNTFFKTNSKERLELLISTENFDFKLIKEYCSKYNLKDIQSYYLLYLKTFLLNWKPKYEITISNTEKKKLVMEENQEDYLCRKCKEIINFIDEKEKVGELLHVIWSQVNFYHYEVFICILDISEGHSYTHLRSILTFLKKYERINMPSDTEKEKWFSSFPECQSLDPLSEFRLLFNNTILDSKDIWNIIRKEISLKNYSVWFEAVSDFSYLTVDNICSFLVKELVAQGVLSSISPGEWLYPKHTSLFMEIDDCLQQMENIQMKTTAAYCLLSNTPEGADQVTIAKITYKYAQEYRSQEISSSDSISFTKIEKKYQRCLSLQILHIHQLTKELYIQLILNIHELLLALYHDERIVKKAEYVNLHCPDINRAAAQLAEVCGLDIFEFRKKFVTDCLLDSDFTDFCNELTMGFSGNATLIEKDTTNKSENNLKRAAYVCLSDVAVWQKHLLEEGLSTDNSLSSNFHYRSRCLKCLLAISDSTTIESLTSMDFQVFLSSIDELTLSSLMAKFNIRVDTSKCGSLTKKLAQIGSPDSIQALAQVCKILKISKINYWEYIIKSAEHFGMFADLKDYLDFTKSNDYKYEKFYVSAWQKLVDHTIKTTLNLNTSDIEENLLKDLFMIQQCPVLYLLNLESSFKKCVQANRFGAAAVLMQYIAKEQSLEFLQNIKNNDILDDILKEIERFESFGVATTTVRKVLNNDINYRRL